MALLKGRVQGSVMSCLLSALDAWMRPCDLEAGRGTLTERRGKKRFPSNSHNLIKSSGPNTRGSWLVLDILLLSNNIEYSLCTVKYLLC